MPAERELLIVGAGGFARETAAAVAALNALRPTWRLAGFLDDDPLRLGTTVSGVPVVGPVESAVDADASVLVATGRPGDFRSRRRLVERLGLPSARYATIVHPGATVGPGCVVGPGSVLLAHADLTTDVEVGAHVAVMPQVVLTHDVVVGDYATLASGVRLGGSARIGSGAYLGSGVLLREGVTVGERSLVGLGSVVTRDVPAGRTWFGAPARDQGVAPGVVT